MKNETQLQRYKKLLHFIDEKFKEDINIPDIEEACHYSYRNINRIFAALQHETIGKYIKRLRLERAAQYLKFSNDSVSDIAYEFGFGDIAAFSKAFKQRFHCSPSAFRESSQAIQEITNRLIHSEVEKKLKVVIEELPDLEVLSLTYHGAYEDIPAIKRTWEQFVAYVSQKGLLTDESIFLAEILDDDEITEQIHCRYQVGMILEKTLNFEPEGLFSVKRIKGQHYAKFVHEGSHESCIDTYQLIYSRWLMDMDEEMADAPVLEFFLNDEEDTPADELLTEIYIPIQR